jgi:hypothetical protein
MKKEKMMTERGYWNHKAGRMLKNKTYGDELARVDHLDVVGRLTPSMNGNQEFTAPRSLVSQAGKSH